MVGAPGLCVCRPSDGVCEWDCFHVCPTVSASNLSFVREHFPFPHFKTTLVLNTASAGLVALLSNFNVVQREGFGQVT